MDVAKATRCRNILGEALLDLGWDLKACVFHAGKPGNWMGVANWRNFWLVVGHEEMGSNYSGLVSLIVEHKLPKELRANPEKKTWHIQDISGNMIDSGEGLSGCDYGSTEERDQAYKRGADLAWKICKALPQEAGFNDGKVVLRIIKNWSGRDIPAIELRFRGYRLIFTPESARAVLDQIGSIQIFYDLNKDHKRK